MGLCNFVKFGTGMDAYIVRSSPMQHFTRWKAGQLSLPGLRCPGLHLLGTLSLMSVLTNTLGPPLTVQNALFDQLICSRTLCERSTELVLQSHS